MKKQILLCLLFVLSISCSRTDKNIPLSLHPENPHYFLFRGKPAVLIGSTEHYGAVMNLDFDYVRYLDELAASGLNVTRTFSGIYVEPSGAFGIERNTLAPAPGRFICPWLRSEQPGYVNGGNKFDLSKWNDNYFTRLKDFISEAGKRNIVVELDLFSNFYDTLQWKLSPIYAGNNINGTGNIEDHREVLSLRHMELVDIQSDMVRKIVAELKDFDNLYYEVCNEPYFGDTVALREWETYMTGVVVEAEKDFRHKHLVSNNVANFSKTLEKPRTGVSIYNFHYAKPPVTVAANYRLNSVIGDNETGFNGIHDETYRTEAWDFILAGGGLFNHLDYSFTAGSEDGTFQFGAGQPGGGGKTLRSQLGILADFINSFDFTTMKPFDSTFVKLPEERSTMVHGLAGEGIYGMCLHRSDTLVKSSVIEAGLPSGSYTLTWVDTKTGKESVTDLKDHPGNKAKINTPEFILDLGLRIVKYE